MTTKNTGGAAFPTLDHNGHALVCREFGMSLRDWFAGQAPEPSDDYVNLQRSMDAQRNPHNDPYKPQPRTTLAIKAQYRYEYADAMLAARGADQ